MPQHKHPTPSPVPMLSPHPLCFGKSRPWLTPTDTCSQFRTSLAMLLVLGALTIWTLYVPKTAQTETQPLCHVPSLPSQPAKQLCKVSWPTTIKDSVSGSPGVTQVSFFSSYVLPSLSPCPTNAHLTEDRSQSSTACPQSVFRAKALIMHKKQSSQTHTFRTQVHFSVFACVTLYSSVQ